MRERGRHGPRRFRTAPAMTAAHASFERHGTTIRRRSTRPSTPESLKVTGTMRANARAVSVAAVGETAASVRAATSRVPRGLLRSRPTVRPASSPRCAGHHLIPSGFPPLRSAQTRRGATRSPCRTRRSCNRRHGSAVAWSPASMKCGEVTHGSGCATARHTSRFNQGDIHPSRSFNPRCCIGE